MQYGARRLIKIILTSVAAIFCTALLVGIACEQLGRWQDRERFPQIGRSVDIDGRSLNINCLGESGPTVVLNSAANQPGYEWAVIQPKIAQFTRVCWWDRAGVGWSDLGPYPRTSQANAKDLHALLQASGIAPPYVLVGYSAGGHDVRVYHGLYPNDVAGVVLVDAAHEEEGERVGPWGRGRRTSRWLWYPNYLIVRMLAETGVLRLMHSRDEVTSPGLGWSHEQSDILSHLQRRPEAVAAGVSSGGSVVNDRLAHESGGLGNKPLIVLTAGKAHPAPLQFAKEVAAYQDVWKYELQPKLARLSTRGRQVIVENASHAIPFEVPEVVVGAVKQVVEEVRGRQD